MTEEEKNQMAKDLMEKIKSIPQLGVLYGAMRNVMPGLMEAALVQAIDQTDLLEEKKLDAKEVLLRCHYLLEKFYLYYGIDYGKLLRTDGTHDMMVIGKLLALPPDAKTEYQNIWEVIIGAKKESLKTIAPAHLQALNTYYKKYNKGK